MAILTHQAASIDEFHPLIETNYYHGESYASPVQNVSSHFSLKSLQAGLLPVSKFAGGGMGLRRTRQHIRESSCEIYVLWLPLKGKLAVTQDLTHNIQSSVGEMVITCGDRPFHVQAISEDKEECSQLHIIVPSHLIRSRLPGVDRLCGRTFSAKSGAALIGAQIFSSLIEESEDISADCAANLATTALAAICESVRQATASEPMQVDTKKAHLERVLRFIDQHLPTQGLTAERVANACNVSRRYLHYLLRNNDTSFGGYLWEARLQQADQWLSDPGFRHFNIVDIAYMCGFRSPSHFSNAYRSRFGRPPREARDSLEPSCAQAAGLGGSDMETA